MTLKITNWLCQYQTWTWKETFLNLFIAYFVFCYIMTRFVRTEKLDLVYKKTEKGRETPISKIVQSSQRLNNMYYTPYLWAWNHYL